MKSLLCPALIITVIAISLVNGQYGSKFYYKNRDGSPNNDGNSDDGVTSSVGEDGNTNVKLLDENNSIPLEFFEAMDNVTDIGEFIDKFVEPESIDPQYGLKQKIGDSNVERAISTQAKSAGCIPDNTVVPLEPLSPSKDPLVVYFPKCTRVKRCSGCCSSPLLSCQPIESETIDFTIFKLKHTANKRRFELQEQEHVLVEQHKRCQCACRIKQEDCNSYQVYDAAQCRCNCTNYNARDKCVLETNKIWDYETCKCRCKSSQQCTTGTYFDEHTCNCAEVNGGNPTKTLSDRRRFILKAIPVEPNNKTMYDTDGK